MHCLPNECGNLLTCLSIPICLRTVGLLNRKVKAHMSGTQKCKGRRNKNSSEIVVVISHRILHFHQSTHVSSAIPKP